MFSKSECSIIEKAIAEAELNCSGEIRVHIDKKCPGDVIESAIHTFHRLSMQNTQLRNGVLFYIASESHKFAVIGDVGINEKVGNNFWEDVSAEIETNFRNGNFVEGLTNGILRCGEKLKEFFPYQSDDINELPNTVSFGD
ncbi:MAG: TPM domain-containing protein [Bacteroidia bacterium]|nr:TPM domain-containing protein [Bacteroidia bacterium]